MATDRQVSEKPSAPDVRRWAADGWERLRSVSPWGWGLTAVIIGYTWYFTQQSLDIHYGLGTATFDYALYDQGVWLLSDFKAPFVTLMGRNLLGDHTSFILLFLVPLYWVAPGAGVLLGTQSLAAALGAVPVYLYARRRLQSGALALLLGSLFLLHPALHWTNLEDFHPDVYLVPLIGFAVYAALTRRWRFYAICVLLALLVKEDVGLVIVPLGIWVAWRRDRAIGLATIGAGVAFFVFMMLVVMQALTGAVVPNAWRIPFGGVSGFLKESISRPGNIIDYFGADNRPFYVWQMLFPYAFAMFRLPDVAAISAVAIFTNVLSTFGYQHMIEFHYSAVALPALALGTVHALGATKGRARMITVVAVTVATLWATHLWSPIGLSRQPVAYWKPDHPVAEAARDILAVIPDDASVSAHYALTPHLARREQIFSWPNPFRVSMYGSDIAYEGTRLRVSEEIEYVVLQSPLSEEVAVLWATVEENFTEEARNDYWVVFRRVAGPATLGEEQ